MRVSSRIEIARPFDTVWEAFTFRRGWKRWWGGPLRSIKPGWEQGAKLEFRNDTFSVTLLTHDHRWADDAERPGTQISMKDRWGTTYEFLFEGYDADWDSQTGEPLPPSTNVTYHVDDFASQVKIGNPAGERAECDALLQRLKLYVEDRSQSRWVAPPPLSPAALAERSSQLEEELRTRREKKQKAYRQSISNANREQLERLRRKAADRKADDPDQRPSGHWSGPLP
jgi:hypothetical protein